MANEIFNGIATVRKAKLVRSIFLLKKKKKPKQTKHTDTVVKADNFPAH